MVIIGNIWYFLSFFVFATITVVLYFILEYKTPKTQKAVLFTLLVLGAVSHVLKLFLAYNRGTTDGWRDVWLTTITSVCVITFPVHFFSKNAALKDSMFYLGVACGIVSFIYPAVPLKTPLLHYSCLQFYFANSIIFIVPLLMVLLKLHKLDYKRIWRMPFIVIGIYLFIIANQAIAAELGMEERGADFLSVTYNNSSFVWGIPDAFPKLQKLVPNFLRTVPAGDYEGQQKFLPLIYLSPTIIIGSLLIPFLMSLPFEAKHVFCKDKAKK